MSIEKSLYEAPQGIMALNGQPDLQIVIEVEGEGTPDTDEPKEDKFNKNLAEDMDSGILASIASDLLADYEKDLRDRTEWLKTYVEGLKLLGLDYEDRTEPWSGACGVTHPLLMEAATKFQAETMMEVFPASGPVKTIVIGKETTEKMDAATRVADDMNYTLTETMQEYRQEHEKLLLSLCLSGNAFKKVYYDPSLGRPVAPFIPAEDVIVPYGANSIESAERVTHRMRKTQNELRKLQVSGFYKDIPLGEPTRILDEVEKQKNKDMGTTATYDDRYQILEMHVNYDLPGHIDKDGIELPYVVTIEKGTQNVLSIRRNWLEDDEFRIRRQHFVHYGYVPGFGFYFFGLIHLIGGHSRSATSLLRQLVDAGTLSNLPGGLKARGLRIKGDDMPIKPGEFRDTDLPSGAIKDNILPLPYKEPSQVLLALMNQIIEDGRRFAAVSDLRASDMSNQAPVGTTLAILERVLKVMTAVQARIHYTMKQEFKLLSLIIRDNTPKEYGYEPEEGGPGAKQADYDCCEVIPVSDPNASTMSQRVVQYQAVLQLSQTAPQIYNLPFLHRQMINTLGVKNAEKIVPDDEDLRPMDPVSENMGILMGKPVKAFLYQDHEAHLSVHMAALQDPKLQAVVGQNPQAPVIMGAAHAHVMEHVAFQYRKEIEKQLGATLPPPPDFDHDEDDEPLPPALETQISALAAQAAAKLLKKDQQEFQMQQAQQQMQDPLIQMQQQELQLRAQEVQIKQQDQQLKQMQAQIKAQIDQAEQQRKQKKDMADAAAKADQMRIEEKQLELEGAKLGTEVAKGQHQTMVQAAQAADQHKIEEQKQQLEGAKLGVDIAKHKAEHEKDLRKHASSLNTELHKHEQDKAHEMDKTHATHEHEIDKQQQEHSHQAGESQEQRDHEMSQLEQEHELEMKKLKLEHANKLAQAKIAAKNKPKPTGGDKK